MGERIVYHTAVVPARKSKLLHVAAQYLHAGAAQLGNGDACHFAHPARLLARLSACLSPGGRLTVAHGMSLAALHRHHAGAARGVSRPMLEPERLAALMPPCLAVDVAVSDTEKYVVSARLR